MRTINRNELPQDFYTAEMTSIKAAMVKLPRLNPEEAVKTLEAMQKKLVGLDVMKENIAARGRANLPDPFDPAGGLQ